MSNTTATNPIICNATGLLVTGSGFIKSVQFANASTAAKHTLLLTDSRVASGTKKLVQLELAASEENTLIFAPCEPIRYVDGLYCETIDGGEALIQV